MTPSRPATQLDSGTAASLHQASASISGGLSRPRRSLQPVLSASLAAMVLWGVMVTVGMRSGVTFEVDRGGEVHHPWSELPTILLTNLAAALGLFSGVVTLGLSTLAVSILLGLFTGAVFSGATAALGTGGAAAALLPYFLFEGLGLVAATAAGLVPLTRTIMDASSSSRITPHGVWTAYVRGIGQTTTLLTLSVALIAVGAVLEILGGLPL